jgi:hypothetical protein
MVGIIWTCLNITHVLMSSGGLFSYRWAPIWEVGMGFYLSVGIHVRIWFAPPITPCECQLHNRVNIIQDLWSNPHLLAQDQVQVSITAVGCGRLEAYIHMYQSKSFYLQGNSNQGKIKVNKTRLTSCVLIASLQQHEWLLSAESIVFFLNYPTWFHPNLGDCGIWHVVCCH